VLQRLHSWNWFLHPSLILIQRTLAKLWGSKVFVFNQNHIDLNTHPTLGYIRPLSCNAIAPKGSH
jgi:hypothetical protein